MLKMECWNIGFFIENDNKSRDLSPRCFLSRDRSDFENVLCRQSASMQTPCGNKSTRVWHQVMLLKLLPNPFSLSVAIKINMFKLNKTSCSNIKEVISSKPSNLHVLPSWPWMVSISKKMPFRQGFSRTRIFCVFPSIISISISAVGICDDILLYLRIYLL